MNRVSENEDVLRSPMTDFSSLPSTTPMSNSCFVRASKVFDISSIAVFNFPINFERGVGIRIKNGNTCANKPRPMLNADEPEDEVKLSKTSVTGACFPSRAPKSCEKPARPMVSSLQWWV